MFNNFSIIGLLKSKDLHKRLAFTLFMLTIYRFISFIPLPGIDTNHIDIIRNKVSGSFLGMFDVFSGGSLSRMTIMALNISPYISSSILFQLLGTVHPYFMALKKEGDIGRALITKYTRYGALLLSVVQGYGLATALEYMKDTSEVVMFPGMPFRILTCAILCCSTMLVIWFSEQINNRGIGNGSSILIYAGIVANLPSALINLFYLGKNGDISILKIMIICAVIVLLFMFIVFAEKIERPIVVYYTKRQINFSTAVDAREAILPIKLNPAGVLPPIFANTVIMFPTMVLSMLGARQYEFGEWLMQQFSRGSMAYAVTYGFLIFSVSAIYASMFFDCKETSDNLNKAGGFIRGYRPGQATTDYLETVLFKVATIGGFYLVLVCVIPEILMMKTMVSLYFSGTSFIIVIGVAMDFIEKVKTAIISFQYEKLFKKGYGGLL